MSVKQQFQELKTMFKSYIDSGRRAGHDMTEKQKAIKRQVFTKDRQATDPEKIANAARPVEFNALGDKAQYMKESNRRKAELGAYEASSRPVLSAEADMDGVAGSMKVGHDKDPKRHEANGREKTQKQREAAKAIVASQKRAQERMKQAQDDKKQAAHKAAVAEKERLAKEKQAAVKAARREKERVESTK